MGSRGAAGLEVQSRDHGGWTVIHASGEIDLSNFQAVEDEISEVVASEALNVALDLRQVGFMDSTGLRMLTSAHQQLADKGGEFVVVVDGGPVSRLLSITGLDSVLTIEPALPVAD